MTGFTAEFDLRKQEHFSGIQGKWRNIRSYATKMTMEKENLKVNNFTIRIVNSSAIVFQVKIKRYK